MDNYQDLPPHWQPKPVTGPQLQLISDMMKERNITPEKLFKVFPDRPKYGADAQKVIAWLKGMGTPASPNPTSPQSNPVEVPEGRYCIDLDGKPHFFRVRFGRKPGFVFLAEQASDQFYTVKMGPRFHAILAEIAKDVTTAGQRYATEMGSCYRCGRVLTDQNNPYFSVGLGPDCGTK